MCANGTMERFPGAVSRGIRSGRCRDCPARLLGAGSGYGRGLAGAGRR
jgi:hypothetical protein